MVKETIEVLRAASEMVFLSFSYKIANDETPIPKLNYNKKSQASFLIPIIEHILVK